MLWLLLLFVAPLCAFLLWSCRAKQKLIAQFVQSRLLANLTVGVSQARQKLRLVLLVAAVVFLILAMARPQWGFSLEEAHQRGLDIVVAIDTSRSMLAADVAPNRLSRAKLAALDLMRLAKNDRLGLVAFAGSAFLQCPLTLDEDAFRQSVDALDVGIIPQGGTAITEAIESALTAFEKGNENHKVLVLFTDGEDQDTGAEEAAEKAAKEGMKIFTIGVGTAEGELIRVPDEQGNLGFLKDDSGNAVKSRLDETLLRKIAKKADGFYLPLQGAKPMEMLYAQGLAPLPKSDSTTKLIRQARERFHWPLGIAIALLLLEMFLPHRKRVECAAGKEISNNKTVTAAAVGALFFLLGGGSVMASPASALRDYDAGNFHTAMDEFKKLSRQRTNDLRLSYNAGAAAYKAKQLEDAEKFFNAATASPDLKLQQQSYYNLGNTLFEAGEQVEEPEKKQTAWENAAQSFENSLKLNLQDADAKNNLEFVKKKLEELKKQQQQPKQQSKKDQNKENKDQDKQDKEKQDQKNDQQQQKQQQEKKDSDKSEDQKKDSARQEKQSPEEKKSQGEKKSQEEKAKEEQKKKSQKEGKEPKPDGEQKQEEAMAMAAGQMTPEQARQFLDMQKQDDKTLIFKPEKKANSASRKLKDW